jgi:hypothetical protein
MNSRFGRLNSVPDGNGTACYAYWLVPFPPSNLVFAEDPVSGNESRSPIGERDSFPIVVSQSKHNIYYWKRH